MRGAGVGCEETSDNVFSIDRHRLLRIVGALWMCAFFNPSALAQSLVAPSLLPEQALTLEHPSGGAAAPVRAVVEVRIDVAGAVAQARVVESTAAEDERALIEQAAVAHALTLRFAPAQRAGAA